MNQAAIAHYGYTGEEFLARTAFDLCPPEEAAKLRAYLLEHPRLSGTTSGWIHQRKDGTLLEAEVVAHTIDFGGRLANLVLARNVTEQRRLEAQLRQAQKMEAVGRLAGGIAHDFNNLLTAILGSAQLALREVEPSHPVREDLEEIRRAGLRAAELTRQLLAYSRRQVVAPKVINVNEVVRNLESMLRRLIREDIDLVLELAPHPLAVKSDPGQLDQVVLNLVVNARDALPQRGRIIVRTASVEPRSPAARQRSPRAGRRIRAYRRLRHRQRADAGGADPSVRAFLHHQGARQGNRPRPRDRVRDREAEQWIHLRRFRSGGGNDGSCLPAAEHGAPPGRRSLAPSAGSDGRIGDRSAG